MALGGLYEQDQYKILTNKIPQSYCLPICWANMDFKVFSGKVKQYVQTLKFLKGLFSTRLKKQVGEAISGSLS